MKYRLYKEEDYKLSKWMGGTTKELALFPEGSSYLERNFMWRLSSATIDKEESDFTKLPDYDRVLMVLDGEVVLSYEGERVTRLKALEQDRFDGASKTKSFGKITDFNLMVRKGMEGYLDLIWPTQEKQVCTSTEETELKLVTHTLYCKEGYSVVSFGGDSHMISAGQLMVIEYETDEKVEYSIMGEGIVIRGQIFYNDMKSEIAPEVIPEEKATFEDFKTCIFLANTQFRWAKYIFKSIKTTWYDEALSSAIARVEKVYLTTAVMVLGIVGIGVALALAEAGTAVSVASLLAWILADCLLISPAIYMAFVPKPVKKHIKDLDKLTPYEQRVREAKLGENKSTEKVLKKYKNSGRNLGR